MIGVLKSQGVCAKKCEKMQKNFSKGAKSPFSDHF